MPRELTRSRRWQRLGLAAALCATLSAALPAAAVALPEIRSSERNRVPACVTPERLMRFITERNPGLLARFRNIAAYYKSHGERHRVRWDYAFYQMIVETNYLQFRNANGPGDVSPSQNNFAGIGTTGGGVPGDRFPDVSTGVLGQIQHLIAYSGEHVPSPVAPRTREKQDDIIALSRRLGRPVTFRDLAGRWAVDRKYARTIAFVADQYTSRFCRGGPEAEPAAGPAPSDVTASRAGRQQVAAAMPPASGLGRSAAKDAPQLVATPAPAMRPRQVCRVFTASYGGRRNVLIRHQAGSELHYTALQVEDGREAQLAAAFIRDHAQGGETLGEFASRDEALTSAFNRCPGGTATPAAR